MAYGSARAFAAAFRAVGLDAEPTPPSDHRTRELGARYTSGDECYPAKVTVGDFMKVLEQPGMPIPSRARVFFMPTAEGPCRFGQYSPYLRHVLDANGYRDTSGAVALQQQRATAAWATWRGPFMRTGWRALLAADILQKLLLPIPPSRTGIRRRPSAVYEACLDDVCRTVETTPVKPAVQLAALRESLVRARDRFRAIPGRRDRSTPLIGIVGEIFCRLNTFSNENLIRRLEEYGAEAWLSDIVEWIWYTNSEHFRKLKLTGRMLDARRRSKRGSATACRSATSTCCWNRSARISPATKSRISTRSWSARAPICRARAPSARWC